MPEIITVSHFERNRIREALNIPADRITTIYNGYSRHFRPMDDIDMQIVNRYIPQKTSCSSWETRTLKRIRRGC